MVFSHSGEGAIQCLRSQISTQSVQFGTHRGVEEQGNVTIYLLGHMNITLINLPILTVKGAGTEKE
jgi:hypothetical protein